MSGFTCTTPRLRSKKLPISLASLHFRRLCTLKAIRFLSIWRCSGQNSTTSEGCGAAICYGRITTRGLVNRKDPASYSESSSFIPSYSHSRRTSDSYFSHDRLIRPQSSSLVSPLFFSDSRRKQKSKFDVGLEWFWKSFFSPGYLWPPF